MSTIHYKRLIEVRILHDYYLSKADLTSFYALDDDEQADLLSSRITREQYDIRSYLEIFPSESTRTILENYRLRMAPTPSGFVLGVKVKPNLNDAGEEEYAPAFKLTDALQLGFRLRFKNPNFNTYTNLKVRQSIPARYFFSNTNPNGAKIFPSLSVPVGDFQAGKIYEPGELAVVGGALQEALEETSSDDAAAWRPVAGNGFANEQDRTLLPKLFPYSFAEAASAPEFTLKKQDGTDIKKITINSVAAFQTLYLDFRQTILVAGDEAKEIDDGPYLLEISGDSSTETMPVYLSDELYQGAGIGAVVIDTGATDPDFSLLNEDGTLITKKKADGTFVSHPIFEIRFGRRSTYWRYRSDSGETLKATAATQLFLDAKDNTLITKELRPLTFYPTFFQEPAQPDVFLPNPDSDQIKKEQKKFFSDMYVSPVKGLIELE